VYHVTNHAIRRSRLFRRPPDYQAFLDVLVEAAAWFPTMRLIDWCLMDAHWHLVLWPRTDEDLSNYLWWVTLTHACRWQRVHGTRGTGYVYKARFWANPVETVTYLYVVCSYVERNPVKARLVQYAEQWPWSSVSSLPPDGQRPPLHDWPIPKPPPDEWTRILREPSPQVRHLECARAIARNAPLGSDAWRKEIGERLRWVRGVRPPGRPRKTPT
jgi:putative transposase